MDNLDHTVRIRPLESQMQALIGYFDSFDQGIARGWAYNRADPLTPLTLHVIIDGQEVCTVQCDQHREDIKVNLSHGTGQVGFVFDVPLSYFDNKPHRISLRFHNRAVVDISDALQPDGRKGFIEFNDTLQATVLGFVDGVRQGQLQGWALRTEPRSQRACGGCTIVVTCEGVRVAQVRANRWRWDVATSLKDRTVDPGCGFQLPIPKAFRKAHPQSFRFHVMPDNVELGNSPYITSIVDDELEAALLDVISIADRLQLELAALRKRVSHLVPEPDYNLADYDRWARVYYDDLRTRVANRREQILDSGTMQARPLVSVLLPTFKPLLADFVAAVESVLGQTYENWELVIVDDGSRQPELTAQITAFCKRDIRIKSVARRKNGNISEATNTAIKAATGEWIAFFDHDDLLVNVALEVMVTHALETQAQVLYSDEDKIDQAGYFLEPNLKPDWNHRYLLGCNYVCHLLFVQANVLNKVGLLRSKYNGAQDHDLILRLSEEVPGDKIHHVPELLYHWRKTPNSTAVDISNKGYAVTAGIAAVADHLERLGKRAAVAAINNLTIYNVQWLYDDYPRVCVIIPFKDQAEMTRECLQRLMSVTKWPGLEIILVNNWSVTEEASAFVRDAKMLPGVKVILVEEKFNFSRLNNLAAAQTDAEFLVFMNNDLFVTQDNWIRILVNETLGDDEVAIVGGKFLYPSGLVQHAGVVVGPSIIGTHIHRGISQDDYGYIGRAALTHEMTAVTAACMLVRADVFRAVGGFDEENLKVAYNDVDFCLKVRSAGRKIIFAADFVAEHHESYSRGSDDRPEHEARFAQERQFMLDRWGEAPLFTQDPAYNPHFKPDVHGFFQLALPSREQRSTASSNGDRDR